MAKAKVNLGYRVVAVDDGSQHWLAGLTHKIVTSDWNGGEMPVGYFDDPAVADEVCEALNAAVEDVEASLFNGRVLADVDHFPEAA
jgi:hypothetical protein